jgi:hypothetical protein
MHEGKSMKIRVGHDHSEVLPVIPIGTQVFDLGGEFHLDTLCARVRVRLDHENIS